MMRFVMVGDRELVAKLGRVPAALKERLSVALFRAMTNAQRIVQQEKLSGQVLHRRSGHLSNSVIANPLGYEENGNLVGFFGVPEGPTAVYGKVHEYGGTFTIREHLRHVIQAWGRQLKAPKQVLVRAHEATYPERSYIRSTFREIKGALMADLRHAVGEAARDA